MREIKGTLPIKQNVYKTPGQIEREQDTLERFHLVITPIRPTPCNFRVSPSQPERQPRPRARRAHQNPLLSQIVTPVLAHPGAKTPGSNVKILIRELIRNINREIDGGILGQQNPGVVSQSWRPTEISG